MTGVPFGSRLAFSRTYTDRGGGLYGRREGVGPSGSGSDVSTIRGGPERDGGPRPRRTESRAVGWEGWGGPGRSGEDGLERNRPGRTISR